MSRASLAALHCSKDTFRHDNTHIDSSTTSTRQSSWYVVASHHPLLGASTCGSVGKPCPLTDSQVKPRSRWRIHSPWPNMVLERCHSLMYVMQIVPYFEWASVPIHSTIACASPSLVGQWRRPAAPPHSSTYLLARVAERFTVRWALRISSWNITQ